MKVEDDCRGEVIFEAHNAEESRAGARSFAYLRMPTRLEDALRERQTQPPSSFSRKDVSPK